MSKKFCEGNIMPKLLHFITMLQYTVEDGSWGIRGDGQTVQTHPELSTQYPRPYRLPRFDLLVLGPGPCRYSA